MGKREVKCRNPRVGVDTEALMSRLGYVFHDASLLIRALTPPSAGLNEDNQRLEFLGDALLQAAMGLILYREKSDWDEGRLSKLRSTLVSHTALRAWSEDLGVELVQGPRSPRQPMAQGIGKPLSDAMEALLAAVYLDTEGHGGDGLATLVGLLEHRFLAEIRGAHPGVWQVRDSKTTLQERAAALKLPHPVYETLQQEGPEHAPTFRVLARMGEWSALGEGGSLKAAQMAAARGILEQLPA